MGTGVLGRRLVARTARSGTHTVPAVDAVLYVPVVSHLPCSANVFSLAYVFEA